MLSQGAGIGAGLSSPACAVPAEKGGLGVPYEASCDGGPPLARLPGAPIMQALIGHKAVRLGVVLSPIKGITPRWRDASCNPGAAVTT